MKDLCGICCAFCFVTLCASPMYLIRSCQCQIFHAVLQFFTPYTNLSLKASSRNIPNVHNEAGFLKLTMYSLMDLSSLWFLELNLYLAAKNVSLASKLIELHLMQVVVVTTYNLVVGCKKNPLLFTFFPPYLNLQWKNCSNLSDFIFIEVRISQQLPSSLRFLLPQRCFHLILLYLCNFFAYFCFWKIFIENICSDVCSVFKFEV